MTMQSTENKLIISGLKLKQIRRSMSPKMNQEDLAKKIGIVRQTLVQWEKQNVVIVDPDQANKIAKVLKVSLQTLQNVSENLQVAEEPKTGYSPPNVAGEIAATLKQYDELYKTLVDSKDKEIERHVERIRNMETAEAWFRNTISDLTKGLAALDKTKK